MYDLVTSIIDHVWDTSGYSSTEQQYVYSICGVIIIVVLIAMVRWIDKVFFK